MRAASNIYEHPVLSDSEVWAKDAYNRTGSTRLFASLGVLSLVTTITGLAVVQLAGLKDLLGMVGLNESNLMSHFRL
jgi:hypothetical protein